MLLRHSPVTKYRESDCGPIDTLSICSICVDQKQKMRPGNGKEVQFAFLSITEAHKKNKNPNLFDSYTQAQEFCKFVTGNFLSPPI